MGHSKPRLALITTVPISLVMLVNGQARYMQRRGLIVHGISSSGDLLQEFSKREGVPVTAVEMTRRITPLRDIRALWSLWLELSRLRPHIVHAHTPKAGLLGTIAAWMAGVPVRIYHLHGLRFVTSTGARRKVLMLTEWIACRLANRVLCVSRSVRERAVAEKLCPSQKITVPLYGGYGIEAEERFNPTRFGVATRTSNRRRYGLPEDSLVVGYVGRIVRDKGLIELATAWQLLKGDSPEIHLLLAGPFEEQDPLPLDVETALRSDPCIHLAGLVTADDMPALYSALDVLTLPSYREGFPLSLLEAAAMGLPTVATQVEGCVDAVQDGVTGTLVPPRDAGALAEALHRYLLDPDLRTAHGRAGRERVLKDFRPEAIWEGIYQEYVTLLTAKKISLLESAP